MEYIIQTRKEPSKEGLRLFKEGETEWTNDSFKYDELRKAIDIAKAHISRGEHSACNIRVVAVVAEFESTIEIKELTYN